MNVDLSMIIRQIPVPVKGTPVGTTIYKNYDTYFLLNQGLFENVSEKTHIIWP
jgi:hypothetical protein